MHLLSLMIPLSSARAAAAGSRTLASAAVPSRLRPWFAHGSSLGRDRAALAPADADEALRSGKFIPVTSRLESFTTRAEDGDSLRAVELSYADLPKNHLEAAHWAWIGRKGEDGDHVFAVEVPSAVVESACAGEPLERAPLRDVADRMTCPDEAALLSSARGLIHFHASNGFCQRCGQPTEPYKLGAARRCTDGDTCRSRTYPRIDPAAIMLVTSPVSVDGGAHALLGRKRGWPAGRWSTLAGFAEVGETLEEAVCREVYEEAGVAVLHESVRFVASQPWLFPQSLMIGFSAEAAPAEGADVDPATGLPRIAVDDEMEDCGWFAREYVRERLDRGAISLVARTEGTPAEEFHIPGKVSMAHLLISEWARADA